MYENKRVLLLIKDRISLLKLHSQYKYMRFLHSNVQLKATDVLDDLGVPKYLNQVRKFIHTN